MTTETRAREALLKKIALVLTVICASPAAAAWAVPGNGNGPNGNGPPNNPPGLANHNGDNGRSADSPAHECFEEREDSGTSDFNDKYGTGPTDRNAFGKCVSQKAQERQDDDD
jgi:hypothetical protein